MIDEEGGEQKAHTLGQCQPHSKPLGKEGLDPHEVTLEGLNLQVAIGEGGREAQGIATDIGGDIRCRERQGCPCDTVQQARHSVGVSAQGLQETGYLSTLRRGP